MLLGLPKYFCIKIEAEIWLYVYICMLVHVHALAHSHLHVYRRRLFTDEKQQSEIKTKAEDRLIKSCQIV